MKVWTACSISAIELRKRDGLISSDIKVRFKVI